MSEKCKNCKNAALPNRKYCQKHLDYINQKARDRVGKCKQCNDPAVDGKSRCAKHQEEIRIKSAERKAKLKENGLCKDCGKEAIKGNVLCIDCNDKAKIRSKFKLKERQEKNKCTYCGKDKENLSSAYCYVCILKDRERQSKERKERYVSGLCVRCCRENAVKKWLCLDCAFEYRIRISLISALKKQGVSRKINFNQVIGCTPDFFREHIRNLMEPWMNETNYGVHIPGRRRWQLGHRVPVASFNLSDEDQLKKCWHYTNIYPQEAKENILMQDLLIIDGNLVRGRNLKKS
jgi:hypothetical protein